MLKAPLGDIQKTQIDCQIADFGLVGARCAPALLPARLNLSYAFSCRHSLITFCVLSGRVPFQAAVKGAAGSFKQNAGPTGEFPATRCTCRHPSRMHSPLLYHVSPCSHISVDAQKWTPQAVGVSKTGKEGQLTMPLHCFGGRSARLNSLDGT